MNVLDRLLGRDEPEPLGLPTIEDYRANDAEVDRIVAEAGPQTKVELPPYSGEDARCPKCHSHCLTTRYFGGVHERCPHRAMWYWPMSLGFGLSKPDIRAAAILQGMRAVEHLDRECQNCQHRWSEATALQPSIQTEE